MNRGHRSIGEVLSLLSTEHPDLTISKIRFLESQGLIAPQRTPSGYRKFFEADIERLNWILVQQRDHFLPLKEIKRRLVAGEVPPSALRAAAVGSDDPPATPSLFTSRGDEEGDQAGAEDAEGSTESVEDSASSPPRSWPTPPAATLTTSTNSNVSASSPRQADLMATPPTPCSIRTRCWSRERSPPSPSAAYQHGTCACSRSPPTGRPACTSNCSGSQGARRHCETANGTGSDRGADRVLHRLLLRRLLRPHLD